MSVHTIKLEGGPLDGESIEVKFLGPWLVAPFTHGSEMHYKVDFTDPERLTALFHGFSAAEKAQP